MTNSDPDAPEKYELTLPRDPDAWVTVYNGRDQICWRGMGSSDAKAELPRGLYTVRVEANRHIEERVVVLSEPRNLQDLGAPRSSALPEAGSPDNTWDDALAVSTEDTCAPITMTWDSSLFILIRFAGGKDEGMDAAPLKLLDASGTQVWALSGSDVRRDNQGRWLAFSVRAAHGYYRLVADGPVPREVPIHLFQNFQTQIFIPFRGAPLLGAMRVYMSRGRGYVRNNESEKASDLALDALMNRSEHIPRTVLDHLLEAKFQNPMLGIIGAHALLRNVSLRRSELRLFRESDEAPSFNAERQSWIEYDKTLAKVLNNLDHLIPNSPDVQALRLIMREMFPGNLVPHPRESLPMLRLGFDAVIRAATEADEPDEEDSDVDEISQRLIGDSVWTCWAPIATADPEAGSADRNTFSAVYSASTATVKRLAQIFISPRRRGSPVPQTLTWIQAAFFTELQWTRAAMEHRKESAPLRVDVDSLALRLGITRRTVEREIGDLEKLPIKRLLPQVRRGWPDLEKILAARSFKLSDVVVRKPARTLPEPARR